MGEDVEEEEPKTDDDLYDAELSTPIRNHIQPEEWMRKHDIEDDGCDEEASLEVPEDGAELQASDALKDFPALCLHVTLILESHPPLHYNHMPSFRMIVAFAPGFASVPK